MLVGARPEQLLVSHGKPDGQSLAGKVNIIQHLGQFVRYEVAVGPEISDTIFEIDMVGKVSGQTEDDGFHLGVIECFLLRIEGEQTTVMGKPFHGYREHFGDGRPRTGEIFSSERIQKLPFFIRIKRIVNQKRPSF